LYVAVAETGLAAPASDDPPRPLRATRKVIPRTNPEILLPLTLRRSPSSRWRD
jgi:hypothetical protein